jgi:hypothetical protein
MTTKLILFILLSCHLFPISALSEVNSSCEILNYDVKCVLEGDKLIREETVLLKIFDKTGENYSDVSIPFSKKEKVSVVYAQIEDQDGNIIRELKKNEIKDRSYFSDMYLYADRFVKRFELKHNVYPYCIRYQIRYTFNEFLEIVDWRPLSWGASVRARHAGLEVQTPLNYPLHIYKNGVNELPKQSNGLNDFYRFEANDIILPEKEKNSNSYDLIMPRVWIVPKRFNFEFPGSAESWKELGNWIYQLNSGSEDLSEQDVLLVRSLIGSKTDKRKIISIIYDYLQTHTRYINVSIGIGGFKPYPASYVAMNKYGDCKALTVYMKAMLKAVNINSYYTLVYADENNPELLKQIPQVQFNHAILCVPLKNDTLFVDCTRKNVPLGYTGLFIQGRDGFIIKKDSSCLVQIPYLKDEEVEEFSYYNYFIGLDNSCQVKVRSLNKGPQFDYLTSVETELSHTDQEDLFREHYFHFPSIQLENWNLNHPNKDSAIIQFTANLHLQDFLKSYGREVGITLYPLLMSEYEKPSNRKFPLSLRCPVNKTDFFEFNIQSSVTLKNLPEKIDIDNKFGKFYLNFTFKDNKIEVQRIFKLYKGTYSLDDYPIFYSFIQQIKKANNIIIFLTK